MADARHDPEVQPDAQLLFFLESNISRGLSSLVRAQFLPRSFSLYLIIYPFGSPPSFGNN